MAKGRKHDHHRHHERLLGSQLTHVGATGADLSDLGEDDVWSTVVVDTPAGDEWYDDSDRTSSVPTRRWLRRQEQRQLVGGLSLAFEEEEITGAGDSASPRVIHQFRNPDGGGGGGQHHHRRQKQKGAASAPVNVPDWPNILRVDSADSMQDSAGFGVEEEADSGGGEWIPPHEYLAAREYATSRKMVATSVFEGVGRTLKGRDMSRVRDAVWSQTGFFG